MNSNGIVVAAFGRSYLVETHPGETLECFPRGKRSEVACGDRVFVRQTAPGQGVIEGVDPRSTLFYRSDAFRQKVFAANLTQIAIVLAAAPTYYEDLLNRCLVAAEHAHIRAIIVLNKFDLEASRTALESLNLYAQLGYTVLPLVAKENVSPLLALLDGETTALIGQSGMGKSTIINGLLPHVTAATAEVSAALDSGRHTTTHARLYHLDEHTHVVDSPGMQEFGLHHLTIADIDHAFLEFRPFIGQCRFANCTHTVEPGCAIAAAVERSAISGRRWSIYKRIVEARRR